MSSRVKLISEEVKFFRLIPLFLGIAFLWSVVSVIYTDGFQKMYEMPKIEGDLKHMLHFLGFYIGNGIPRFVIYLFCAGFIMYNYNKFFGFMEQIGCLPWIGFVVGLLFIATVTYQSGDNKAYAMWIGYGLLLWFEYCCYRVFLTHRWKRPDED